MGDLMELSNDLNVITAEINSYKQVAGQAIFEIGRRLKHVKENDLVHGEYQKWLDKIGFNKSNAYKFVKAYEQFSNSYSNMNLTQTHIFEIVSLPQDIDRKEFIEKEHEVPSSGEKKKVEEMTIRELKEVKAELKKVEEEKKRLVQLLTEERNKPVKVETVHKEVVPEHIKSKLNEYERVRKEAENNKKQLENVNRLLQKSMQEKSQVERELQQLNQKYTKEEQEIKELELKEKKLKHEAHVSMFDLQLKIQKFIKESAPSVYLQGAIAYGDMSVRKELVESVKALEDFSSQLKNILGDGITNVRENSGTIIDVEVM